MNFGEGKWPAVCAVVLSLTALLSAARAAADPTDDAFIAALAKGGIVMADPNTAITLAHSVCAGFDQNETTSVVAMSLMKETVLSLKQASYFVGVSISAYCPQYKARTDATAN